MWLGGCQSSSATAEAGGEAEGTPVTVAALQIDRSRFNLELEPPQLLRDEQVEVQPLTDDAMEKASLSFEQVLEQLEPPDYITESREADEQDAADRDRDEEPPAASVRAYTLGRLAYQDGERLEAVNQLEEAHRLDPDSAHVLRVLGRMYFAFGNEARGAQRLKDAVRLDGSDAESLFLLGRYAAQQARWEEAVVTLARSAELEQADLDPAIRYLRPFYLGQALFELHHDAAAIEQMHAYLELPQQFSSVTRLHRELAFIDRRRGQTHVQVGDALARLGRLDEALAHYEQATEEGSQVDAHLLMARRVYLLMAMGHEQSAEALLIDQLREQTDSQRTVQLVSYVAEHGPSADALSDRLQQVYREAERPASLALAMADLLERDEALSLLDEHLEHSPAHRAVFERMLALLEDDEIDRAVRTTATLIREQPDHADRYSSALLGDAFDADAVLEEIDALDEALRESAAAWYLRGAAHEEAGRTDQALSAYDRALEVDRTFSSPHLANIELQIRLERFEQALEMLDEVADDADRARARLARARAYAGLDRVDEAIDVLDDLILQSPRQAEPRLLLGELQMDQRQFDAAKRTLMAVLDVDAGSERAYELLFELYDERPPNDDPTEPLRLLQRAQRDIPDSRVARLRMVTNWLLPRRDFEEAEQILEELIEEDPNDYEALSRMVGLLGHTDRWDEAQKLLLGQMEHLGDGEQDVIPLMLLEEVVKHTGDTDAFYAEMEAFLDRQQPSAEVYLQLARLYDAQHLNRPDKAIEVLRNAIELEPEFVTDLRLYLVQLLQRQGRAEEALPELTRAIEERPEAAAELYCVRAAVQHRLGDREEAERDLEKALEIEPEHPRANNDLAYYWAEDDRHLERAMEMATIAVEAEPESGAYLDTLGWIHYKLGNFEQAVEHLEAARETPEGSDAVILDHLGDALWRAGREDEAVQLWRSAEREADRLLAERADRPDLEEVRSAARQKAAAATGEQEPAVAPVPGEGEQEPDDSAEPAEPPDDA